jgi:hypothetical protein
MWHLPCYGRGSVQMVLSKSAKNKNNVEGIPATFNPPWWHSFFAFWPILNILMDKMNHIVVCKGIVWNR